MHDKQRTITFKFKIIINTDNYSRSTSSIVFLPSKVFLLKSYVEIFNYPALLTNKAKALSPAFDSSYKSSCVFYA
jgi:hypothetical protein